MTLKDLVGEHVFTGIELGRTVINRCPYREVKYIKFELDNISYIALEDPGDDYRSYMDEVKTCNISPEYKTPPIEVMCIYKDENEYGWKSDLLQFVDKKNGKVFLTIGTRNIDDYYLTFVFGSVLENLVVNGA